MRDQHADRVFCSWIDAAEYIVTLTDYMGIKVETHRDSKGRIFYKHPETGQWMDGTRHYVTITPTKGTVDSGASLVELEDEAQCVPPAAERLDNDQTRALQSAS